MCVAGTVAEDIPAEVYGQIWTDRTLDFQVFTSEQNLGISFKACFMGYSKKKYCQTIWDLHLKDVFRVKVCSQFMTRQSVKLRTWIPDLPPLSLPEITALE